MGIKKIPQKEQSPSIEEALMEIRPYIQGHGGDISLVKFENNIVFISLTGACQTCPFSIITLKMGVEERLKQLIPSIISVELVAQ
jgi:Fe-S cluster biogenesis protein NfuA